MAHEYLRRLPDAVQWRFDVVRVYDENPPVLPRIELFKNAFSVS